MQRMVAREITSDQTSNLVAMITMILSLPQNVSDVDAILVLPGQGEDWRLTSAIKAWEKSLVAKYLLIAGSYSGEKTWFEPTFENLASEPYNLTRREGVIIHPHAHHTKEQGMWVAAMVRDLQIERLALVVSPYHLPRAYLTLVKCFEQIGVKTELYPAPVRIPPGTPSPETGLNAWQLVPGEVERIMKYQGMGDVATYEELQKYLEWAWESA